MSFDATIPYRLSPQASVREEPFGGLAYHAGNRRLVFLRAQELVDVVRGLDHFDSAEAAVSALSPERRSSVLRSLAPLAASGMIEPRPGLGDEVEVEAGSVSSPPPAATGGAVPAFGAGGPTIHGGGPATAARGSSAQPPTASRGLTSQLEQGLEAPVCITWELTYGCNLACIHCLSSSGRRDPAELSTAEAKAFLDELAALSVFYVNVGGGEPTLRPDFDELVEHAVSRRIGIKFSTNGTTMTEARARRLASMDYVDVQVSIDGATAETNDRVRGIGSYAAARTAMENLAAAGFAGFKISVVVTRHNVSELDGLDQLAGSYGAQLRLTRLRPSGRGVDTWDELHPTAVQQRELYSWLLDRPHVLTGDSFFHLSALGAPLPGLNLCGAGRVVCLVDPVGDVYACPFVLHPEFKAGSVRGSGGFTGVWRTSELFTGLREPETEGACSACGSFDACHGGCMAAKFFTGLPLSGPDPECVFGWGESARTGVTPGTAPSPGPGHSKPEAVAVALLTRPRRR
jgi:mycofactocin radical SAM maturase